MTDLLSDEWFDAYAAKAAALPELDGADATITYEVGGAPAGKVRWNETIERGRVTSVEAGKRSDADLAITWKYDEFVRLVRGETTYDASYMEGRTKVEGNYVCWVLGLRDMRETTEWRDLLESVAPVE